jgi:hypothetical protein
MCRGSFCPQSQLVVAGLASLHRSPASRRKGTQYKWPTLFLGEINMVMRPAGLRPDKDCAGDAQQELNTTDRTSRQRGNPEHRGSICQTVRRHIAGDNRKPVCSVLACTVTNGVQHLFPVLARRPRIFARFVSADSLAAGQVFKTVELAKISPIRLKLTHKNIAHVHLLPSNSCANGRQYNSHC